ncbi:MAG TPA: YjbE family putative metal transport protein [Bacilli bacterium]|nr:YjbE family putative metal transport protein [Bacilli bacterium]
MDLTFTWLELVKVIALNLVLSGDNSVVIALACRQLPPKLQKKAFFWGAGAAVVLKFALMFLAASLLKIPFLQAVGGLLLFVIAVKLLQGEEEGEIAQGRNGSLLAAIKAIIIADLVMSLDNAVAVVAVADGNVLLILAGLLLSTPMILWGADLLAKLMARFSLLIYGAAALLGATAGEMISEDAAVRVLLPSHWAALVESVLPWVGVALVLLAARQVRRKPVRMSFQEWKRRAGAVER